MFSLKNICKQVMDLSMVEHIAIDSFLSLRLLLILLTMQYWVTRL